ncbi:MAG: hypothetical protein U5L09_11230 [Bacteroidales bacterium]|nr:hypothetical protein [Bacteroidales bacterium]
MPSGAMIFQHVSYISDTVMWHPHVNKLTITLNPALHQISGPAIRGYGYYDTNYRQISNISSIREASLNEKAVINPAAMLNSVPGLVFHRGARNTQRLSIRGAGARVCVPLHGLKPISMAYPYHRQWVKFSWMIFCEEAGNKRCYY